MRISTAVLCAVSCLHVSGCASPRPEPVRAAEVEAIQYRCYGYMYGREGLQLDYEAARHWCRRSAELENNSGQTLYAELFYLGHGVEPNYSEAAKWYLRAAENEHSHAQLMLGRLYRRGHGVDRDHVAALYWLGRSAAQGNEQADAELHEVLSEVPY